MGDPDADTDTDASTDKDSQTQHGHERTGEGRELGTQRVKQGARGHSRESESCRK